MTVASRILLAYQRGDTSEEAEAGGMLQAQYILTIIHDRGVK